jgi:Zn finger protein HypA/HybF involved in hydrogenase expression
MPNEFPLEQVAGNVVRRTGWTSDARRCPVHGDLLELCFDETDYSSWSPMHQAAFNHDDNRVRWRCPTCVGSWFESFFLEEPNRPLPDQQRFLLTCPVCSGRRLTHECVPACCGQHRCIDCGARFELAVDLLEIGTPGQDKEQEQDQHRQRPIDVLLSTAIAVSPAYRSGWVRPYRLCPEHKSPLELVFVSETEEEPPTLLAWHCDACQRSWTEPLFRHLRRRFAPDATPGAMCPHCHSEWISASEGADNIVTCRSCNSTLRLRLGPRKARPRRRKRPE